jgi:TetR/AcrR family transcriptional repressor of nem operon
MTKACKTGFPVSCRAPTHLLSHRIRVDRYRIADKKPISKHKPKNAYLECLKHYNATVNRRRGEALFSAPTAAGGVRALFNTVPDCLDDSNTPSRLCLMAGSITHEVMDEPNLREYVKEQMSLLAERMVARLNADKEAGLLSAEFDPELVAPVVITYLQGMWRMALVSYERPRFERQIDMLLTGLGL